MASSDCCSIILPGYECQLNDDGVAHSKNKVDSATKDLLSLGFIESDSIHKLPCRSHDETIQYRNSCTFQILMTNLNDISMLCYAMRSEQTPIPLNGEYFPIATHRIQEVMKVMIQNLNATSTVDQKEFRFNLLRKDLSSVSFVSSWGETMDCITTLNYCEPFYVTDNDKTILLLEAQLFCTECNITSLILRSKKRMEVVGRAPPCINDILYLDLSCSIEWKIKLKIKSGTGEEERDNTQLVPVYYRKPQDAFQHPNGNTMIQALQWMFNKLQAITSNNKHLENPCTTINLLEMYCGAGAHTVPIAMTNLFDNIVAVELDQRLVDACKVNANTNKCYNAGPKDRTPIYVFTGDAGEWASKCLSWKHKDNVLADISSKHYWQSKSFQVLLVDPPRAGLDQSVCQLAIHGSFEHIIYISCGRQALLKDLQILSEAFDVVDCTITDLFPRTSSVETLVHLKRRKAI